MPRSRALLFCLTALLIGACRQAPQSPSEPQNLRNVIIVLVDTLRADHMSLYGYHRETTPFIDHLEAGSVIFERARSQSSCTFPSVNSLMTSRYPGAFTKQEKGRLGIPEKYPAIAEILDSRGFHTVAVSASPIVRATPSPYNPNGGFGRGFDTFVEGCMWRHGACLSAKVERQLDTLREPFFLYLHYMEPHAPYKPPDRYSKVFAGEYEGHDFIRDGNPNPIGKMIYADGPSYEIGDRDIEHLVDLYDDEIRYFDGVLRRLFRMLEARNQVENTLIVLTSDHGEEFLEHGHVKHCRGLWDTVTHVPLMFLLPNGEQRKVIDAAVGNIDIVPTILDYLEIESDGFGFKGSSLRSLIEGAASGRGYAFADAGRYRSVDDGRFHLILDVSENQFTLFDVRNDPLEQNDLYDPSHPEFDPLSKTLEGWLGKSGKDGRLLESLAATRAKEEELRALGYLE
jgi:arylsulfatase A-like enzyme